MYPSITFGRHLVYPCETIIKRSNVFLSGEREVELFNASKNGNINGSYFKTETDDEDLNSSTRTNEGATKGRRTLWLRVKEERGLTTYPKWPRDGPRDHLKIRFKNNRLFYRNF